MYKKGDLLDKLCVRTLKKTCPNKQVEKINGTILINSAQFKK